MHYSAWGIAPLSVPKHCLVHCIPSCSIRSICSWSAHSSSLPAIKNVLWSSLIYCQAWKALSGYLCVLCLLSMLPMVPSSKTPARSIFQYCSSHFPHQQLDKKSGVLRSSEHLKKIWHQICWSEISEKFWFLKNFRHSEFFRTSEFESDFFRCSDLFSDFFRWSDFLSSCWYRMWQFQHTYLACLLADDICQNQFLRQTPTKAEESGGVYASLGTRQEDGRFEDVGLSVCVSPLWILVLGFRRAEFWRSAVGLKISRGVRETEEMEELAGSIQCNIRTEELPPQRAEIIYYNSGYIE